MPWASFRSSLSRRRAVAFVLALIAEVLFLLAFLFPPTFNALRKSDPLVTIELPPAGSPAPRARPVAKARAASAKAQPPQPITPPPIVPPKIVLLSKQDFDAGDISKLPSHKGEGTSGTSGKGSASTYGPGEGPGGAQLYNAEWYVEPTPGEMALYLPGGHAQPGWAMIMCQTIPNYRVDNCRQLGESPPGSGLSRALRQAAWQFKVRPPRIDGKPIIGAWVRIRFDWLESKQQE